MLTIFPDFNRCACLYGVALSYRVLSLLSFFCLSFSSVNHVNASDKNLFVNSHKLRVQTQLVTAPKVSSSRFIFDSYRREREKPRNWR
ncbi:hypothetical protein EDD22DRAFT_8844 [Suillus occidentalis]|nr:hypothetical protein EDD22DRAFT_8844 [Suillus occidentalis]